MNTSDQENTQAMSPLPPHQAGAPSHASARRAGETADAAAAERASTLIEFPGANRNRPAWRKELSERVREIQQRRAREAAQEVEETTRPEGHAARAPLAAEDSAARATRAAERAKQLGLVPPPPETPELNPIVVAALKRIERARTPPQRGRAGRTTHAATAAARVVEESYEPAVEPPAEQAEPKPDTGRLPNLVAVPPKQPAPDMTATTAAPAAQTVDEVTAVSTQQPASANTDAAVAANTTTVNAAAAAVAAQAPAAERPEPQVSQKVAAPTRESAASQPSNATQPDTLAAAASAETFDRPQPRRIQGVIDDHWLERHGADPLPKVVTTQDLYDDRASVARRCAAAMVDLLVVGFLSAPFAAVIELSFGNWGDLRVQASMGGVVLVMMFLYLTCSTALAGRTFGQRLFALHTVDADSALAPTTGQCVRRTIVYMLSLAAFGLGLLYALFDAEGRTAHDLLSRTVIVKE